MSQKRRKRREKRQLSKDSREKKGEREEEKTKRGTERKGAEEEEERKGREERTAGIRRRENRREKIELNWGQIDSSRESLHSIWRLPNRVRLTPFKTFTRPAVKVLKEPLAFNEVRTTYITKCRLI